VVAAPVQNYWENYVKDARLREVQNIARQYAYNAIENLIDLMNDPNVSDKDRITAANILLDRAGGKPPLIKGVKTLDHIP
jgi:HEAT repeat protein